MFSSFLSIPFISSWFLSISSRSFQFSICMVSIQFRFDFLRFPFNFLSIFSLFFSFSFSISLFSSQFPFILSVPFNVLSCLSFNLLLISIFLFKSLFLSISFSCPFVSFQLLSISFFILVFLFVSSIFLSNYTYGLAFPVRRLHNVRMLFLLLYWIYSGARRMLTTKAFYLSFRFDQRRSAFLFTFLFISNLYPSISFHILSFPFDFLSRPLFAFQFPFTPSLCLWLSFSFPFFSLQFAFQFSFISSLFLSSVLFTSSRFL